MSNQCKLQYNRRCKLNKPFKLNKTFQTQKTWKKKPGNVFPFRYCDVKSQQDVRPFMGEGFGISCKHREWVESLFKKRPLPPKLNESMQGGGVFGPRSVCQYCTLCRKIPYCGGEKVQKSAGRLCGSYIRNPTVS